MTDQNISILDLETQYRALKRTMEEAVIKVMASGQYVLGPEVEAFEREFAFFLKSNYSIGVNSGTDALYLALKALGIGPGDEVITTPCSFVATTEAIIDNGAVPVFVDVNSNDSNINPDLIESKISSKTKAILPVHLYGFSCDMKKILSIAQKNNLKVVEDCAQSVGAYYSGVRCGTESDAGCFSFYPTKNLGAFGDAGAVSVQDEQIAERIKLLRTHGSTLRGYHDELGINSRLDEIQATILRVKMLYVDRWNAMRRRIASYYEEILSPLEGIEILTPMANTTPVYCLFCIRIHKNRDAVQEFLAKRGITSMVHYPVPIHLLGALKSLGYQKGDLPISEKLSDEILALPMYPELTLQDQDRVADGLRQAIKSNS